MQLAYCNNDLRRLEYYIDELVQHDDLFLLCFYSQDPPFDPDINGKLCTAHIVTLHKDVIIDTAKTGSQGNIVANYYPRLARQTKRIFRVVPVGHPRCLGNHGSVFFLEFLGVTIGWGNISLSENPPDSVVKILLDQYDNHPSCKTVPGHLQSLCLEPNSSEIVSTSLFSVLMMLIHEVNVWDIATDYHWAVCKWCGDSDFGSGRKTPHNVVHRIVCHSCGNDPPLTN